MVKKFCIKEFKNFFHSTTQKFEHVYVTIKESKFFNTLLLEELWLTRISPTPHQEIWLFFLQTKFSSNWGDFRGKDERWSFHGQEQGSEKFKVKIQIHVKEEDEELM